MTLFEAFRRGLPLVIQVAPDNERLAAAIEALGDDHVFFADIGWPEASSHPFHVIKGAISETEDGWQIGVTPVRLSFAGERLHEDWLLWQQWRESEAGRPFTSARALAAAREQGLV